MMRLNKGFTLIELLLSMTFVSILLIAVALLTIQLSNIYTRGITMRQVNTAGQELANEFQRSIQAAQIVDADEDFVVFMQSGETNRVRRGSTAYAAAVNATASQRIIGGRLCLQDKSYIWNTGSYLLGEMGTDSPNKYMDSPTTEVHLAQVNGDVCGTAADTTIGAFSAGSLALNSSNSSELLQTGDRDLAVHKFYLSGNPATGLYTISFTLGTNRQGTLTDDSDRCKAPNEEDSNQEYCAVNRFDIVTRTIPDRTEEETP